MDLSDIFLPHREEINYLIHLMTRRDKGGYEHFHTKLDEIFGTRKFGDKTPLEILKHAFRPLLSNLSVLADNQGREFTQDVERFEEISSSEQLVNELQILSDIISTVITDVQPKKFSGKLNRFKENPEKLKIRFAKLVGHCIQHMKQFALLHRL